MSKFTHEKIYRGDSVIELLAATHVTICGVGALGSILADSLARQGFAKIRIIDNDRVEEHNVNTQIYGVNDVGAQKVDVLKNQLFRALEIEIETIAKRLERRNAKQLLQGSDVVIDTFDNSESRQIVQDHCRQANLRCLHVGLSADYGEVIWDDSYKVPADVDGDVCEYPLARNLVLMSVALATETLISWIVDGVGMNRSITLGDFKVSELEAADCN